MTIDEAREALEFYANRENWEPTALHGGPFKHRSKIDFDGGARARLALGYQDWDRSTYNPQNRYEQ